MNPRKLTGFPNGVKLLQIERLAIGCYTIVKVYALV